MSLGQPRFKTSGAGFPRVGGDEPRIRARERREMEFSPRERG